MEDKSIFWPYLAAWAGIMLLMVANRRSRWGVGLTSAYCFQLWLLYWVGALIHALPWSEAPQSDLVFFGFQQSTWALLAFVGGVFASGLLLRNRNEHSVVLADGRLAGAFVLCGAVSFGVLLPTIGRLPTLNALVAVASQLVIVGCCLGCWQAWIQGDRAQLYGWLAACCCLPLVTIVSQGFLAYGTMALGTIVVFVAQFFRPRRLLLVGFLALAYAGSSFYVVYMRDRMEIRATVWGGSSLLARMARLLQTVESIEPFDLTNPAHLAFIDERLNQNTLVGAAVVHLQGTGDFARGQTLRDAVLALVPRAFWPDKPVFAGSGMLVSRFTGMEFAAGTSVGIGPVMELYANFSTAGVATGFFVLGILLALIDARAGDCLRRGDWQDFAVWFLVGIAFLQVSGSLVEVTSSALASLLVGVGIRSAFRHYRRRRPISEAAPAEFLDARFAS